MSFSIVSYTVQSRLRNMLQFFSFLAFRQTEDSNPILVYHIGPALPTAYFHAFLVACVSG